MARSSRASVTKRNNKVLKRNVFGPVETKRNERLNAKLLELAQQPKPPRAEMDVEEEGSNDKSEATKDVDMDADGAASAKPAEKSNKALKREKTSKAARIEKKRVRKPRNRITFTKHPKKAGGKR